jgi:hypothetical protein
MARLPNISKYCTVCPSSALASSKVWTKLVPSIGSWAIPSTAVGSGRPTASRTIGATSMQWVNCLLLIQFPGAMPENHLAHRRAT